MRRILTTLAALTCFTGHVQAQDLMVTNAKGYSFQNGSLVKFDTLLIRSGRVAAAGQRAHIEPWAEGIDIRDAKGAVLLPGLIDAHGHVFGLGFQALNIDLSETKSLEEALALIKARMPDDGWILGRGWNQVIWGLGRFPTARELDRVTAGRPAAFERVDGHATWVNSKALELAGITKDTPDPQGGRIERDANGNPTGVLVDAASSLVEAVIPEPSRTVKEQALEKALEAMAAVGLTGAHDAGVTPDQWEIYKDFASKGRMSARIYGMIAGVGAAFDALSADGPILGIGDDRLFLRAVKLYADGALGSRGAALHVDYSDDAGNKGLLFHEDTALRNQIARAVSRGYQVNVHAIGDKANSQVLDAFTDILKYGGKGQRHRIEHAQVLRLDDIPRLKDLNLIASMQPIHATSDKNMAEDRLGAERIKGAYAWRKFLNAGVVIAAGSDFPVEPVNPFYGLHAAVTRRDRDGNPLEGWYAEESLSVTDALRAFTLDAAYAGHMEDRVGSLEAGKWADFILIDRDIFTINPQDIWKTKVLETWVGGVRVYHSR